MRARRISLSTFRKTLGGRSARRVTVLAGAGVSMIPPTELPSGGQLRDICVERLLVDDISGDVVGRLLRTPAYRGLLPEAVLQIIGSTAGEALDRFMQQVLRSAAPNVVHQAVVKWKCPTFTTNFDLCFEAAGGRQVRHLHGSIVRPESLQNQLYRLGKTSHKEATLLGKLMARRVLLVIGYSLRDEDIIDLIKRHPPKRFLYLSFDGKNPSVLRELPCEVSVFLVTPCSSHGPKVGLWPSRVRLPALQHRANALLRICSRAGLYDVQVRILRRYLPRLRGRSKLLAMCEVADSLRLGRKFEEARRLSERVLKDSAARLPVCADAVSTALVECGLVALDRGDTHVDKIESLFRRGLEVFERLVATETAGKNRAENDIWRARIFNNLGLVLAARGEYSRSIRMYERSIALKARHHERYGIAQTSANLARLQILNRKLAAAAATVSRLVDEMERIPDVYICGDAVAGCLVALSDRGYLSVRIRQLTKSAGRTQKWWRKIERSSSSSHSVKKIVRDLAQLSAVYRRLRRDRSQ
jgi:hypothetical protein